jgi:cell division protein FtsZ
MARERGILTVGVVTKPFTFEGSRRARAADDGIAELTQFVDTLIVIPNQNLFRLANERTGWKEAFKMADNVLYMGVRGVTDLMVAPGMVNLDFADIRTVMAEMGKAMMGTGEAEGENRAIRAAEAAISNPLLEDTCMAGARGLLINITGGEDMTLFEVDQAANRIREEVDEDANIIFGSAVDENLNGKVRVSVVATGIESAEQRAAERPRLVAVGGGVAAVATQAAPPPSAAQAAPQQATMRSGPAPAAASLGQAQRVPMPQPRPLLHTSSQPAPAQPLPQPSARLAPAPAPVAAPAPAEEEPQQAAQPQAYDMDLDEPPAPPRQIPPHLQQPLRPLAQGQKPRASARPGSGLFAEPPRGEPAAPPPRRSLFGIVTGAIRSSLPAAAPAEAPSAPAYQHDPSGHEHSAEPIRANVRPAMGEEMGIDIPAFLRRQSS